MASFLTRAGNYLGNIGRALIGGHVQKKSKGEATLVSMLPGWGWGRIPGAWSANRHELVAHYKHWNYICIRTIAETGTDAQIQVATVEPAAKAEEQRRKAWFSTRDPWERAKKMAEVEARWLPASHRRKALASIAEGDELIPVDSDDRWRRLLKKPNPVDNWWTFFYRMFMYPDLAGGFYLWWIPGGDGLPAELWCLPPNWIWPIASKPGELVSEYELRPVNGYAWGNDTMPTWIGGSFGTGHKIPRENCIQVGYPNPVHYLDFYSPVSAVAEWIDLAENIDRSRVAVFQNGAFPGVGIELDADMQATMIDQGEVDRVKADIANKWQGVQKAGVPIVLYPGMKLVPLTKTNVEMDYTQSFEQIGKAIRAAHKVGGSMLGMSEVSTLAARVAEDIGFYKTTMKPKFTMVGAALTEIGRLFNENYVTYYPDPTPDDPAQINSDIDCDGRHGAITPNEIRKVRGREPFGYGGDDPLLAMGISPIPFATGQEPEDAPVPAVAAQRWDEDQSAGQEGGPGAPGANGKPAMNGNGKPAGNGVATQGIAEILQGRGKHLHNGNGHAKPWEEATHEEAAFAAAVAALGLTPEEADELRDKAK